MAEPQLLSTDPNAGRLLSTDPGAGRSSQWQPGLEARARNGPHEMTDAPDAPPGLLDRLVKSDAMQSAAHPQTVGDLGGLIFAGRDAGKIVGSTINAARGPVGRGTAAVGSALESLGQSDAASHLGTAGAMTELWHGKIPEALLAAGAPRIVTGAGRALRYAGVKIAGAPTPPPLVDRYMPNSGGAPAAATVAPGQPRLTTWSNAYAPESAAGSGLSPEIEQELLRRGIQPSRVLDVQVTSGANRIAPRMAPPTPAARPAPPVSPVREQELLQQFGGRGPASGTPVPGGPTREAAAARLAQNNPALPPTPDQQRLRDAIQNPRPQEPWTPEAAKARLDANAAEQWHSGSESGGPYAARDAAAHKMDAELDHWYRYHLENPTSAVALAASPAAVRAILLERMKGGGDQ